MTVKELMDQLATMPPDAQVQRYHSEDDIFREHYEDLLDVSLVDYPTKHVELGFA